MAPELIFQDVRFRAYRGSELRAMGRADRATYRRETSDVTADALRVELPAEPGRDPTEIEAARGEGNVRRQLATAEGSVTFVRGGSRAKTERATYSAADGLVRGDRPVRIEQKGFWLEGPRFTLDPKDGQFDVTGGVTLTAEGAR